MPPGGSSNTSGVIVLPSTASEFCATEALAALVALVALIASTADPAVVADDAVLAVPERVALTALGTVPSSFRLTWAPVML